MYASEEIMKHFFVVSRKIIIFLRSMREDSVAGSVPGRLKEPLSGLPAFSICFFWTHYFCNIVSNIHTLENKIPTQKLYTKCLTPHRHMGPVIETPIYQVLEIKRCLLFAVDDEYLRVTCEFRYPLH